MGAKGRAQHVRPWPDPDLLWNQRFRRLLEDKQTRCARRETFRV